MKSVVPDQFPNSPTQTLAPEISTFDENIHIISLRNSQQNSYLWTSFMNVIDFGQSRFCVSCKQLRFLVSDK